MRIYSQKIIYAHIGEGGGWETHITSSISSEIVAGRVSHGEEPGAWVNLKDWNSFQHSKGEQRKTNHLNSNIYAWALLKGSIKPPKISLPNYLSWFFIPIKSSQFALCVALNDDLQLKLNVEIIQLTKYNNEGAVGCHICCISSSV